MFTSSHVQWRPVAVFYILACVLSWPFFAWMIVKPESWSALPVPGFLKTTLFMWGPGIVAIVTMRMVKSSLLRSIQLFDRMWRRGAVFFFVPLIALALVYINDASSSKLAMIVSVIGPIGFINTLGEELGWRGFLQDALRPLPMIGRLIIIAVM